MTKRFNPDNERLKREYLTHMVYGLGADEATVDKAADALQRFENSTGFKPFKAFRVAQAVKFKDVLQNAISPTTGRELSLATVDGILRQVKAFFQWLSAQRGYRSKLTYSDMLYFNLNRRDARVAHAERPKRAPTLEQCAHAFASMPEQTDVQKRDKALFAFFMLTAARVAAVASLTLKRIDLIEGWVDQDARDVRTKGAKTFRTVFLPIGEQYRDSFYAWVRHLREDLLFGNDDPLFPPIRMSAVDGAFKVDGFERECYQTTGPLRAVINRAFASAGIEAFSPHAFRRTIVKWGDKAYPSREAFKAFSQNIGHDSEVTTVGSYLHVSEDRQVELIRGA